MSEPNPQSPHAPSMAGTGGILPVISAIGNVPLIGRTTEHHLMDEWLDNATRTHGGVMVISGEQGVGKTRLADTLTIRPGRGVLRIRCEEHLQHVPFFPFLDLAQYHDTSSGLASLLASLSPPGPSTATRFDLLGEISQAILSLCREPACILVVDQLEWIDAASADLLRHLVHLGNRGGWAILATMRIGVPEITSPLGHLLADWNRQRLLFDLPLMPLDRAGTQEMVNRLLGNADDALCDLVFSRTDGLPFFIEELVRMLVTEGLAIQQGCTWHITDPAKTPGNSMSFGIAVTILRRLDYLPAETRQVLRAAAVLGTRCSLGLLAQVAGFTEAELPDILAPAVSARIFRLEQAAGSGPADSAHGVFTHALIRDALYAAFPQEDRRTLHHRAADILNRTIGERDVPDFGLSLLAYHAERAHAWELAFNASLAAGDAAMALLASKDALNHFNRALKLFHTHLTTLDAGKEMALSYRLVSTLRTTGHLDEAAAAAREMAERASATADSAAEAWAWIQLAGIRTFNYNFREVLADLDRGTTIARNLEHKGLLAAAFTTQGAIDSAMGDLDGADQQFNLAIPLADDAGNQAIALQGLTHTGLTATWRGQFRDAIDTCKRAVILAEQSLDAAAIADARFCLALALAGSGEYDAAMTALANLLELAKSSGESYYSARVPNTIGYVYRELGMVEEAIPWDERAIAEADQLFSICHFKARANGLLNLTTNLTLLNRLDEAEEVLHRADHAVNEHDYMRWRTVIRLTLCRGELALARGKPAAALDLATEAVEQAATRGSAKHELQAHDLAGRALLESGNVQGAITHLEQAVATASTIGYRAGHWRSLGHLAQAHAQGGNPSAAHEHNVAARRCIADIAEHIEDTDLRNGFLGSAEVANVMRFSSETHQAHRVAYPLGLTAREVEVLRLVAEGLTNAQIADHLYLSPKTVSSHLVSVFGKLGVTSRSRATRFAIENDLLA